MITILIIIDSTINRLLENTTWHAQVHFPVEKTERCESFRKNDESSAMCANSKTRSVSGREAALADAQSGRRLLSAGESSVTYRPAESFPPQQIA